MATKIIYLGGRPKTKQRPVEFHFMLNERMKFSNAQTQPSAYKCCEVITENYLGKGMDLFLAYNATREDGQLFVGKINDRIIE